MVNLNVANCLAGHEVHGAFYAQGSVVGLRVYWKDFKDQKGIKCERAISSKAFAQEHLEEIKTGICKAFCTSGKPEAQRTVVVGGHPNAPVLDGRDGSFSSSFTSNIK